MGFEHRGHTWRKSVELGYWLGEVHWGRGARHRVREAKAFDGWVLPRGTAGKSRLYRDARTA